MMQRHRSRGQTHRLLIEFVDGEERRLGVEGVEDGLDEEDVATAIDQALDLHGCVRSGGKMSRVDGAYKLPRCASFGTIMPAPYARIAEYTRHGMCQGVLAE